MIADCYAVDYQVHSTCSHDGRATIDAQCAQAVELGLDEIGFSEHKDFDPDDPMAPYFDYSRYMEEIERARKRYGRDLRIRAGIEIDYQKWFEPQIESYLREHRFDFVIGSVHYVDRLMIMTPEYNLGRDVASAYRDYFGAVRSSVESGLFDIVGHLEYANRRGLAAWGPYNAADYVCELRDLFAAMVHAEVALEINTAGLHQGLGITYPVEQTVALYAECGGTLLSLGSDAHEPANLAWQYAVAVDIATRCGLNRVCTWENRNRTEVSLTAP